MNLVVLIGSLASEVELRSTNSGKSVANMRLREDRADGEKGGYFTIVVWDAQAENAERYLTKGSQIAVEGRLQNRSYTKNDETRWVTEVVAFRVSYLDSRTNEAPAASLPEAEAPQATATASKDDGDDIPF